MGTCFFCGTKQAASIYKMQIPIFKLQRYVHLGVVRRFEYNTLNIPVDRCFTCFQFQKKLKRSLNISTTISAMIGFFLGLVIPGAFLFTAIIGGVLGHFFGRRQQKRLLKNLGLKGRDSKSLSEHPLIKDKLNNGWTLGKP